MVHPLGAFATALTLPCKDGRLQTTWQTQNSLEKTTTLSTTFSLTVDISNRTSDTRTSQHLLRQKAPTPKGQVTNHNMLAQPHSSLWITLCLAAMAGSLPPSWAGSKLPGITLHAPQGKSLQTSPFLGSRCHIGTFLHVIMKHTTLGRATSQCLAVSCTGMEQAAVIWGDRGLPGSWYIGGEDLASPA